MGLRGRKEEKKTNHNTKHHPTTQSPKHSTKPTIKTNLPLMRVERNKKMVRKEEKRSLGEWVESV